MQEPRCEPRRSCVFFLFLGTRAFAYAFPGDSQGEGSAIGAALKRRMAPPLASGGGVTNHPWKGYGGIPPLQTTCGRAIGPAPFTDLYRSLPYSQISPEQASRADKLNVYTVVTCRAKSCGNERSVLLSRPQMRTDFGLFLSCAKSAQECARVRISPTTPSQAEPRNVYTGVTCHAKSGGNEPSRLWSALALFAPLCSFWREGKSNTPSQASIPQMMFSRDLRAAKRGMSGHRRFFNTVHTVNDSSVFSTPSRFLTERRIRQILCRVYTRAARLERQS
jgi:hypothetical protein